MKRYGSNREDLEIGLMVEINPRSDRTRKMLVTGVIGEILSKTTTHPHGILVKLVGGEIGRVKRIVESGGEHGLLGETKKQDTDNNVRRSCLSVIEGGENHYTEFKTSILWSSKLSGKDIQNTESIAVKKYGKSASKIIIAKTLAAFLNSDGGVLVIGVKEDKHGGDDEIVGVDSEFIKLPDPCVDGYRRMILDGVIKSYFPSFIFNHLNRYIQIRFEEINSVSVCCMHVYPSDKKVFLRINNQDLFLIRVDASTRQIDGEEIVDYCVNRFK